VVPDGSKILFISDADGEKSFTPSARTVPGKPEELTHGFHASSMIRSGAHGSASLQRLQKTSFMS